MSVGRQDAVDALRGKQQERLTELLKAGLDPDTVVVDPGFTLLHYASTNGFSGSTFKEGVRVLLEAGANPNNLDDRDHNPLHEAVRAADTPIVKLLLGYGADVTQKTTGGNTPLDSFLAGAHTALMRQDGTVRRTRDVEALLRNANNECYLLLKNAHTLCFYTGNNAAIQQMRDTFKSGLSRVDVGNKELFGGAFFNLKAELARCEEFERNRGFCQKLSDCFHPQVVTERLAYMDSLRPYIAMAEFIVGRFEVPKVERALFQTNRGFNTLLRTGVVSEDLNLGEQFNTLPPPALGDICLYLGVPKERCPGREVGTDVGGEADAKGTVDSRAVAIEERSSGAARSSADVLHVDLSSAAGAGFGSSRGSYVGAGARADGRAP
jgi:hypothetical protein